VNVTKAIRGREDALVWGGLGFLGRHLVSRLLSDGVAVSILSRSRSLYPTPSWASNVRWFELHDGEDHQTTLLEAVSSASVIYDFAGSSGAVASNRDPLGSLELNCRKHLEFLRVCEMAANRPHVVFASSWLVYGATNVVAVAESHALAPQSMYAAHKICIENYLQIFARRNKITYTICRISNPYGLDSSGPGATYKVLNSFIQNALADLPITLFGDGGQLRDFIYISDLIDALVLCGCSPQARNELLNISSGVSHTVRDAVFMIRDLVGAPTVNFVPWPEDYQTVESGDYVADISAAKTKLGFTPAYDLRSGLEETIRQYRKNGSAYEGCRVATAK
jgi:UDP-glucose 4-epimerase